SGETSRCDPEVGSWGVSSGPPLPVDVRVLRDLEVMKSDHNLDTTVTKGSLAVIRERYSIPVEYGSHVPQPGQRPYSLDAPSMFWGFRLDWSAHPIGNASSYLFEEETVLVDRLKGILSSSRAIKEMIELWLVEVGLSPTSKDQMDLGKLRGMPKVTSGKVPPTRPAAREVPQEGQSADEKTQVLFKTKVHKDDAGYYTLLMSDLGHQDPEKEMKAIWKGLKNSTKVWNNSSTAEEFEMGLLHPQLARELYTLPSDVLIARAAKEMVLMTLFDRVHDAGRLITFMNYRIKQLQEELDALKYDGGPEAVAKGEERASEL
ncbi:hypothetical protein B296_00015416, partial [Ensete ventricosum]